MDQLVKLWKVICKRCRWGDHLLKIVHLSYKPCKIKILKYCSITLNIIIQHLITWIHTETPFSLWHHVILLCVHDTMRYDQHINSEAARTKKLLLTSWKVFGGRGDRDTGFESKIKSANANQTTQPWTCLLHRK